MNNLDNKTPANAALSRPLTRFGLAMGGLTLMVGGTGSIIAAEYVDEHLAPTIAQDLSTSLNRPVKLGNVTSISPRGIRFGYSSIPPTDTDADAVEIEAIAVHFSLLDALDDGIVPLTVTLIRPEIFLDQNDSDDWLDTEIDLSNESRFPVRRIHFRQASLMLAPSYDGFEVHPRAGDYRARQAALQGKSPETIDTIAPPAAHVELEGIRASFQLSDQETQLVFSVRGRALDGGRFRTEGHVVLDGGRVEAEIDARDVAIAPLASLLPSAILVEDGFLNGNLDFVGEPGEPVFLHGTADLKQFSVWVEGEPNPFTQAQGRLTFDGQTIHMTNGAMTYGWIPFDVEGIVHLEEGVNLQAQVQSVSAADFMATFNLALPFSAEGTLKTDNLTVTGKFGRTVFAGTVTNANPVALDQVAFAAVRTDFTLDKGTNVLTLMDTEFTPTIGGRIAGNARVQLGDMDDAVMTVKAEDISADAIAQLYNITLPDTQLGSLNASTQVIITEQGLQAELPWSLADGDYAAKGVLAVADDRVSLRDATLQVGQDILSATGELVDDRWQATLRTDGFSLASAIPHTEGHLNGAVTLSGDLALLSLADIRADGAVEVTDVLPTLSEPVQVAFGWQGDRLHIKHARTSWFEADGWMDARLTGLQPAFSNMDLNVRLQAMNLASLPVALPLPITGQTQFEGKLTGNPAAPLLDGQVRLADLAIGAIAFEPDLRGRVRFSPDETLHLALTGKQDTLQATGTLNALDFELQRDQATVRGQVADDHLKADLHAIPLAMMSQIPGLGLSPNSVLAALNGELSGQVAMDWADENNPALLAQVAIANPTLGTLPNRLQRRHGGDRLVATLRYRDGIATLSDGQLRFGESQLRLAGELSPDALAGQIQVERGDLKDVMTALRTMPTDLELSEPILALAASDETPPAFDMAEFIEASQQVRGTFTGGANVQINPTDNTLEAVINLSGQDWRFGRVQIDRINLSDGQINGAYLRVPELRLAGFAYGEAIAPQTTLVASLDTYEQRGSLQVNGVPLAVISRWVNSPLSVTGELGAIARWHRTGALPTVTGTLSLTNPSLGTAETDAIQVGFSFENDVLQVGQWQVPGNPVELIATGRIPVRFPFWGGESEEIVSFVFQDKTNDSQPGFAAQRATPVPAREFGVDGADEVVLSLGLMQPSFSIAGLDALVETGEVPEGWDFYLDVADLDPEDLRAVLTHEIPLDFVMVDHLMNSPLGEQLLTFVGTVIETPSGGANVQALRSALVFSARNDGRVSVLEFLHHYPHDEIFIDLDQLSKVLDMLEAPDLESGA